MPKSVSFSALKEKIHFRPHDVQKEILKGMRRFTVVASAKRLGKSILAAYLALREMFIPRHTIWIVGPNYELASRVWDYVEEWIDMYFEGEHGPFRINKHDRIMENETTGAKLWMKTTENPSCYDNETEILAKSGWKRFEDLELGEYVLTRDTNGVSSYQPVKNIIKDFYSGDMYIGSSKSIDFCITPSHRVLVSDRDGKEKIVEAADVLCNHTIPMTSKWLGENRNKFILPSIEKGFLYKKYQSGDKSIDMDKWVKFLGIWLAEGSVAGSKGGMSSILRGNYQVFLAQTKIDTRNEIRCLLESLPFKFREKKDGFEILDKQLWSYLKPLGCSWQKYVPEEIKNLSSDYLKILFDWAVKGDGYVRRNNECVYISTSERLVDDFQEILQKIGLYGIIYKRENNHGGMIRGRKIIPKRPCYNLAVKNREYASLSSNTGKYYNKKKYSGYVYCCSVDNGIVYVRKNKKPIWSGNSLLGKGLDLAILDEAARIDEGIWDGYIRPNLMDKKGRGFLISNPFGYNWFYDKYLWGTPEGRIEHPEYISFSFPTAIEDEKEEVVGTNNPYAVSIEELVALKRSIPRDIWTAEYLGEFKEGAGQRFKKFDVCIDETIPISDPNEWFENPQYGHLYFLGCDIARVEDFTVATVVDRMTHRMVGFYRVNNLSWEFMRQKIRDISNKYNNAEIILDATGNGGSIFSEDLRNVGANVDTDFVYTNKSKALLIDKLAILIDRKKIKFPRIPQLIQEIRSFSYHFSPSGNLIYGSSRKDDCLNSLALACWKLNEDPLDASIDSNNLMIRPQRRTYY